MINTEEMDRELLAAGHITKEQFEANQMARARQAEYSAMIAMLAYGRTWRTR
jgi:hypothetical protein